MQVLQIGHKVDSQNICSHRIAIKQACDEVLNHDGDGFVNIFIYFYFLHKNLKMLEN